MKTLGERIASLRGTKNQDEFAKEYGKSRQTLAKWESGVSRPDDAILYKMSIDAGVPSDWLFNGFGGPGDPESRADVDILFVPMVEAVLSAGNGSFETSSKSERMYAFRSSFLHSKGSPDSMVLMRVTGDSMEPVIMAEDFVLIDQSQNSLRPGLIYAVGVEDMVYIKIANTAPGKLILSGANPAHKPIEVDMRGDLASSVRILGRCVWSCREL